jgi:hypothetical protein
MLKIIPADRLTGELHTKTEIRNGTRFQLKFIPSNNSFIFFKWFEFWRIYFLSFIISIDIHYRKNADYKKIARNVSSASCNWKFREDKDKVQAWFKIYLFVIKFIPHAV